MISLAEIIVFLFSQAKCSRFEGFKFACLLEMHSLCVKLLHSFGKFGMIRH